MRRFSIRELLLITAIAALAMGSWAHHRQLQQEMKLLRELHSMYQTNMALREELEQLKREIAEEGSKRKMIVAGLHRLEPNAVGRAANLKVGVE